MTSPERSNDIIVECSAFIEPNRLAKPFRAASIEVHVVYDVVVGVLDQDGNVGVAYTSAFTADTANLLCRAIGLVDHHVVGLDPFRWKSLSAAIEQLSRRDDVGAAHLMETALASLQLATLELAALRQQRPVADLVGGTARSDFYLSGGSLDATAEELRHLFEQAFEVGAKVAKVKISGPNRTEALGRVDYALSHLHPDLLLAIDANQTLPRAEAAGFIRGLKDRSSKLAWLEEPISAQDVQGLARLRSLAGGHLKIAGGESLFGRHAIRRLIETEACDIILANPVRHGGPHQMLEDCGKAGLSGLRPVGHVYPQIGTHLFSVLPDQSLVEYLPWWDAMFEPDAYTMNSGQLTANREIPGFGIHQRIREKFTKNRQGGASA